MKTKKSKIKKKKGKVGKGIAGFGVGKWLGLTGGMVLLLLIALVVSFYSGWRFVGRFNFLYKKLPLPVAEVGVSDNLITSREWLGDFDAVKKFYSSGDFASRGKRIDFSTKQGQLRLQIKKKDILDKLIEDTIIVTLAKKNGITVTDQEVDEAVQKSLDESGGNYQELILNLKSSYGWSLDDFKNKIVKNQLYTKKLFKWYQKNILKTERYKKAQSIRRKIIKDKDGSDNFSEIAKQFSEGDSFKNGGELDWMTEEQIIPEVLAGIQKLKPGEVSDIIVSSLGMHIVKLKDVREVKKNKKSYKEYQLQQIFIRGISFVDWLQMAKKETKVKIFIGKYRWDKKEGRVVFNNPQLQQLEEKIRKESEGDPSL